MSPCLPFEVLLDCFDYATASRTNTNLPDYKCLRSISLVSKKISPYAQKALFRTVFLSKGRHALAFKSAIRQDTSRGRWLASLVYSLRAQLRQGRGRLTEAIFTASILACTGLFELDIDVCNHQFDIDYFRANLKNHQCLIQALRLSGPTVVTFNILQAFPSVKYIQFKETDYVSILPSNTLQCNLVQLYWPGFLNPDLDWLLSNSVGTLEILRFGSKSSLTMGNDSKFERLMMTFGSSLRSLQVPPLTESQAYSLHHCTQLEELIYNGPISEKVLKQLPDTLEHLQVQLECFEIEFRIYEVKTRLLPFIEMSPSLLVFTWVHDGGLAHNDLRDACESRGIIWRRWIQPYGMYPGEKPVLEDVVTFPQALSLSPLRYKELACVLARQVAE